MKKIILISIIFIFIFTGIFSSFSENIIAESSKGNYLGSINSDKYHKPDCRWAKNINPENEIWFKTTKEAKNKGYKPCGTCF